MDLAHIHLLLNHFPIIGTIVGVGLFLISFLVKTDDARRSGLIVFVVMALLTIPAFKAASFAPRESIDLKTLTTAVRNLEDLTGEEVEIEESALAAAFKKLADEELKLLLPVIATAQANNLPVGALLDEYQQTLIGTQAAASDDCVRILAGEGKSLRETRDRVRRIREAVSKDGLATLRLARTAINRMWPVLEVRGRGGELQTGVEDLRGLLDSANLFERISDISKQAQQISQTYQSLYRQLHEERREVFNQAIDEVKGRAEWLLLAEEMQTPILASLTSRACDEANSLEAVTECQKCKASIGEMESDLAALPALKQKVIERLRELTKPPEEETQVVKIKLVEFFADSLDSETAVNEAIERLREHLLRLVAEKAKFIVE